MKAISKAIKRVEVKATIERKYEVVLTNSENQTICALLTNSLREALTEAAEWADFCGIVLTPYRVMGKIVEPVTKDTYKQTTLKTFAQLHAEYRTSGGELNWNKLMHWEWQRFRGTYKDKEAMKLWLLPHFMESKPPTFDEAVARAGTKDSPAVEWLSANATGSWMPSKGGYRFSDDRDAALFKLFFAGN
jgi:hypothetical protein